MRSGAAAEDWVAAQLHARGVQIRARNYRCRLGEIDLIAEHENTLIFIEVKTRKQLDRARASVDHHKQRKLRLTAAHYLSRSHWEGLVALMSPRFVLIMTAIGVVIGPQTPLP